MGWVAPRKKTLHMTRQEGEGSVEQSPGFHSKLHLGLRPLPDKHNDFVDSAILQPPPLGASALLCQSQRPSGAEDKLMINLKATAL